VTISCRPVFDCESWRRLSPLIGRSGREYKVSNRARANPAAPRLQGARSSSAGLGPTLFPRSAIDKLSALFDSVQQAVRPPRSLKPAAARRPAAAVKRPLVVLAVLLAMPSLGRTAYTLVSAIAICAHGTHPKTHASLQ